MFVGGPALKRWAKLFRRFRGISITYVNPPQPSSFDITNHPTLTSLNPPNPRPLNPPPPNPHQPTSRQPTPHQSKFTSTSSTQALTPDSWLLAPDYFFASGVLGFQGLALAGALGLMPKSQT